MFGRESPPSFSSFSFKLIGTKPPAGTKLPLSQRISGKKIQDPQEQEQNHNQSENKQEDLDAHGTSPPNNPDSLLKRLNMLGQSIDSEVTSQQIPDLRLAAPSTFEPEPVVSTVITSIRDQNNGIRITKSSLETLERSSAATLARFATDVESDTTEEIGSSARPSSGERVLRVQPFGNALGVTLESSTPAVAVASTIIADTPGPTLLLAPNSSAPVPVALGCTAAFKDASSTSFVDMVQGPTETPLTPLTVLLNEEREAWGEVLVSKQKSPPVEQQSSEKDLIYRTEMATTNAQSQPGTPDLSMSQGASPRSPQLITPELPSQAQTANVSSRTQSDSPTVQSRLVPADTPVLLTTPTISNVSMVYAQAHGAIRLNTDLEKEEGYKKESETIAAPATTLAEISRSAPTNRSTSSGTRSARGMDRSSAPESANATPNTPTALPPRNADDGTSSEPSTMSMGSPEAESSVKSRPGIPQLADAALFNTAQKRASAPLSNGGQTVPEDQLRAPPPPGVSQALQEVSREEREVEGVGESGSGGGAAGNTHNTVLSAAVPSVNRQTMSSRRKRWTDTHKDGGQNKILGAVGSADLSKSLDPGKQITPPRKPHPLPPRPPPGAGTSPKAMADPATGSMKRKHAALALPSSVMEQNKRLRQDSQEPSGILLPPPATSEGKIKVEPTRTPTPSSAVSHQSSAQAMLQRKRSLSHVVKTEKDSEGVGIASGDAYIQAACPQSRPAKRLREEQTDLEATVEPKQQEAQIQEEDDFMFPVPESPTGRSSTSNRDNAEVNKAPLYQRPSSTQPRAISSQPNERSMSAINEVSTRATTSRDRSIRTSSDRNYSSRRSSVRRDDSREKSGGLSRDEDERGRRTTRSYRPISPLGNDRRYSYSGDSYRPYSPSPPVRGPSSNSRGSSYRGRGGGGARTPPRRIGYPSPRNRTPPRNTRHPSDGRSSWRSVADSLPPPRAPLQTDPRQFNRQISPDSRNHTLAIDSKDSRPGNERASRSPPPIGRGSERNILRGSYNESKRPVARPPGRNTPPHMRQVERGPFRRDEDDKRNVYDGRANASRPGRSVSPNPRQTNQREGGLSRPDRHGDAQYTQQRSSNFFVDGGPDQYEVRVSPSHELGRRLERPQEISSAIRHAPEQQRFIQSDVDAPNPEQTFLGAHSLGDVYCEPKQSYDAGHPPGWEDALNSTQLRPSVPLDPLHLQAYGIPARPSSSRHIYDEYVAPEINPRYRYIDGSSDGPDDGEDAEDAHDMTGDDDVGASRTSPNHFPHSRIPTLQAPLQAAETEAHSYAKPQARPLPPSPARGPQNLRRKQNKRNKDDDLKILTATPIVPKSPVARLELRERFDNPPPQIQTSSTPIIRRPSRPGPSPTTNNPIRFADRLSSAPALPIRSNSEDSIGGRRGRRTPQEDERPHRRRSPSDDTAPALLDRMNDRLSPTRVLSSYRGGGRGQVRGRGRGRGRGQGYAAGVGRPDQNDNAKPSLEERLS